MPKDFRGSQKHILDLLGKKDFPSALEAILKPYGVALTAQDFHRPLGPRNPEEWELPRFCRAHCQGWLSPPSRAPIEWDLVFKGWWLRNNGKLPTWDFISSCLVKGRNGLLLVEAKAHEGELNVAGKPSSTSASARSKENHAEITLSIERVCQAMRKQVDDRIALSLDSHYQLVNRIAWAWRLAEHGLPIVLLYLGFIGDTYFAADHLRDANHWQRTMGSYMNGVIPSGVPGRRTDLASGGAFLMLVESLPVLNASPRTADLSQQV